MTATLSPVRTHDQARTLRELIQRRSTAPAAEPIAAPCRTLAVVSGKGGVGKSLIALNLAVALSLAGRKVCLLDANVGLGSLELMCGLNGYWNLSHVVSGARQLSDIVLKGPEGIALIPGASGICESTECPASAQTALLAQLSELERRFEFLIIDTGSGMHRLVRQFALAADQSLVVTTPEPTSITDAYATIKSFSASEGTALGLVVNQADSPDLADKIAVRLKTTTRMFLRSDIDVWGSLPRDAAAPQSISARQPLMTFQPMSPAARGLTRLAQRYHAGPSAGERTEPYFSRLVGNLQRAA